MTGHRLKYHRLWLAIGFVLVGALLVLSLIPDPPKPLDFDWADKLEHFAAYALLMAWFMLIYQERAVRARIAAALVFLGFIIEVLQGMSGARFFDYTDAFANAFGVVLALWLVRPPLSRMLWVFEQRFA